MWRRIKKALPQLRILIEGNVGGTRFILSLVGSVITRYFNLNTNNYTVPNVDSDSTCFCGALIVLSTTLSQRTLVIVVVMEGLCEGEITNTPLRSGARLCGREILFLR